MGTEIHGGGVNPVAWVRMRNGAIDWEEGCLYSAECDFPADFYPPEEGFAITALYLYPNAARGVDEDAKPDAWWNGQRPTTDGICIPSINWDREDTNHDIPLFAGFNPQGPVMRMLAEYKARAEKAEAALTAALESKNV